MKCLHLFNGIGGFQLAADWMGWENVASCEIDDFCNKVTKHHFPNCVQHGDIKTTDFSIYRGRIDILTGGFPCQTFSLAGDGAMDMRLWKEMYRAIRQVQPHWIVGENVYGFISRKGGVALNEVQTDLEAEGYEVQSYIIPACAVNAPHRRDRVWIVAHAGSKPLHSTVFTQDSKKLARETKIGRKHRFKPEVVSAVFERFRDWRSMGEPGLVRDDDGLPETLDRLKAIGNAIPPHVAYQIFKAIEQYNTQNSNK